MTIRRKLRGSLTCCGAEVDRGVACHGCGRVAGRPASAPLVCPPPPVRVPPPAAAPAAAPPLVAVPKPRKPAKPAGKHRPERPRKRLRARNPERMAKRTAEDFGPLGAAVRRLTCSVVGCDRTPCDPAHVVSRATAGAWVWSHARFRTVGNLAPLCRGHHTGMPGFAREVIQHQVGVRAFEQNVELAVKLPGEAPRKVDRLAEVAELVGDWFLAGARGLPEAPC